MKIVMPAFTIATVTTAVVVTTWWAVARDDVVSISDPCNTFVSEFAPAKTPALTKIGDQWWLTISYTPAPNEEALRVHRATLLGERTFKVEQTGRLFRARNADAHLQIRLESKESSVQLLNELCYKN